MRYIVVSLIGIPGSGKTTFALKLVGQSKLNLLNAGVVVVHFDHNICLDFNNLQENEYKQCRENVMKKTEELINQLSRVEQEDRNKILSIHELKVQNYHLKPLHPVLIILDDNFYFRSMRQRTRAMCKILNCDHFQIFMKSSLEVAKRRNCERPNTVPESVIEKMFLRLQVPTNPQTIVVEPSATDKEILEMLHDKIENPEKFYEPTVEQEQEQKQSLIHHMDIITRKELSIKINQLDKTKDFKVTCIALNKKRKEFLEDLRAEKFATADDEKLRSAFKFYLNE